MRRLATVLVIVGISYGVAPVASAHVKVKPVRCPHGKVRKTITVKARRHRHLVKVHKVVCVKRKHALAMPVKDTPTPTAPAPVIKLHAHLDPSFTRDPSNPFKVTYAYSASATSGAVSAPANSEPTPLPEGVLALYNDGLLACSINVGATTTGGDCPVTYSKLGEHTVTTIYQSGSTSATETSVENIEPFSTKVVVTYAYTHKEQSCPPQPSPYECEGTILGQLTVTVGVVDQNGNALQAERLSAELEVPGTTRKISVGTIEVGRLENGEIWLATGGPTRGQEGVVPLTAAEIESGKLVATGHYWGATGYAESTTAIGLPFVP